MQRKSYYTVIIIILAAIFVTLGILIVQTNTAGKSVKAVLLVKSMQQDFEFWNIVKNGAAEAAKEYNVELYTDGPMNEEDTEGQIELVDWAISLEPEVIILAAVDREALLESGRSIKDKGIKLILVDSGLSESIEDCFVGTDNYAAANFVGAAMAKDVAEGEIAIVAHQRSTSTSVQRLAGFEDAIAGYKDIELVDVRDIGDSVQKSREATLELLKENPALKGIFATNQISAEGVTAALKESGRRDIIFYAIDSSTTQNEALEQGIINGFAVQMPFNMGYTGVTAAVDAVKGSLRKKNLDTGFEFATRENMDDEKIQKLIYPFW